MPKGDNDKAWESIYPREPHPPLTEDDLRRTAKTIRRYPQQCTVTNWDDGAFVIWFGPEAEQRRARAAAREAAEQARLAWWC